MNPAKTVARTRTLMKLLFCFLTEEKEQYFEFLLNCVFLTAEIGPQKLWFTGVGGPCL